MTACFFCFTAATFPVRYLLAHCSGSSEGYPDLTGSKYVCAIASFAVKRFWWSYTKSLSKKSMAS